LEDAEMMKALAVVAAATSIIAGTAGAQGGQNGSVGVKREVMVEKLKQLSSPQRIRVSHDNTLTEGMFGGTTESSVVVSPNEGGDSPIAFDAIDGVWIRKRSAVPGALMGATMGGVGFGALVALFVNGMCESANGCAGDAVGGAVLGGIVGAAGGAVIGGGFGWLVKRWVRIDH
jgi:hypothetical protein